VLGSDSVMQCGLIPARCSWACVPWLAVVKNEAAAEEYKKALAKYDARET